MISFVSTPELTLFCSWANHQSRPTVTVRKFHHQNDDIPLISQYPPKQISNGAFGVGGYIQDQDHRSINDYRPDLCMSSAVGFGFHRFCKVPMDVYWAPENFYHEKSGQCTFTVISLDACWVLQMLLSCWAVAWQTIYRINICQTLLYDLSRWSLVLCSVSHLIMVVAHYHSFGDTKALLAIVLKILCTNGSIIWPCAKNKFHRGIRILHSKSGKPLAGGGDLNLSAWEIKQLLPLMLRETIIMRAYLIAMCITQAPNNCSSAGVHACIVTMQFPRRVSPLCIAKQKVELHCCILAVCTHGAEQSKAMKATTKGRENDVKCW